MTHCDSYAEDVCEDMVEIGIDVWQGITPENDIHAIAGKTQGSLLLFGGLDMPGIDYAGVTEETVRAQVRDTLDLYAPSKRFFPMFPSWLPLYPGVLDWACDEMDRYGPVVAERVFGGVVQL